MSYEHVLLLPCQAARARLFGKGGKKREDIEKVSGATLSIEGLSVRIQSFNEESLRLAVRLVLKSKEHRLASLRVAQRVPRPKNALKSDLLMAAYYTYSK